MSEFFSISPNPEGYPQFIHTSNDKTLLCFSARQALDIWNNCDFSKQILQKFIIPIYRIPSKLRIYWKATSGPRYYLITSSTPFPKTRFCKKLPQNHEVRFKYSLKDFPYAGHILKTSFNDFMPIKNEISQKLIKIHAPKSNNFKKEVYLSKFMKDSIVMMKEEQIPMSVKQMMEVFVNVINKKIGKIDKKVVTELIVDFVRDENENWYLISCKYYEFDYLPINTTILKLISPGYKKSILNQQFAKGFFESIIDIGSRSRKELSIELIKERLENVRKKIKPVRANESYFSPTSKTYQDVMNSMVKSVSHHKLQL